MVCYSDAQHHSTVNLNSGPVFKRWFVCQSINQMVIRILNYHGTRHLNSKPFDEQTNRHDLNTKLVSYSDPHCINRLVKVKLVQKLVVLFVKCIQWESIKILVTLLSYTFKNDTGFFNYLTIFPVKGILTFPPPGLGSYSIKATASYSF